MRAKFALVAGWQRCGDRRPRAGHQPDLTDKADNLGLQEQILHDHLGGVVADRVRWQAGRVDHAMFDAGGHQDADLAPFLARFWGTALRLGE
jgi:hypothetical protein